MQESKLDLVMAGTQDAVLMVESEAKELSEEIMLGAVMFGHKGFQQVIEAIIKLAELAAKEPRDFTAPDHSALEAEVLTSSRPTCAPPTRSPTRQQRYAAVDAAKAKVKAAFAPAEGEDAESRPSSSAKCSRTSRPRSCAGTSSTPARASTAAT